MHGFVHKHCFPVSYSFIELHPAQLLNKFSRMCIYFFIQNQSGCLFLKFDEFIQEIIVAISADGATVI